MKHKLVTGFIASLICLATSCVNESGKVAATYNKSDLLGLGNYSGEVYQTRLDTITAADVAVRSLRKLPIVMLPVASGVNRPIAAMEINDPSRTAQSPRLLAELKVTKVTGEETTLVELVVFEQVSGKYPNGQRHSLIGHSFYKSFENSFLSETAQLPKH